LGGNFNELNLKIKSRDFVVQDGVIIITKQTEEKINKKDLLISKANILRQKERLQDKNIRLIDEYNKLLEEESHINEMMQHLGIQIPTDTDKLEKI
jgi:hypothetical protein